MLPCLAFLCSPATCGIIHCLAAMPLYSVTSHPPPRVSKFPLLKRTPVLLDGGPTLTQYDLTVTRLERPRVELIEPRTHDLSYLFFFFLKYITLYFLPPKKTLKHCICLRLIEQEYTPETSQTRNPTASRALTHLNCILPKASSHSPC